MAGSAPIEGPGTRPERTELTADEFSARHGVVASTLRWWALRLERKYKEEARPELGDAVEVKRIERGSTPASERPRRSKPTKPAEIRVAKIVPVPQPSDASRYGAVIVELSEGRARITCERGADQKMAAKLVATLATTRKR